MTCERTRETALPELIAGEWADAATYLALSRRVEGRQSRVLRQLFQQEQAHAACLKGIYHLTAGVGALSRRVPQADASPEQVLRGCYGRMMRRLAAYEEEARNPDYGGIFSRLAQQEREHCRMVLELLKYRIE